MTTTTRARTPAAPPRTRTRSPAAPLGRTARGAERAIAPVVLGIVVIGVWQVLTGSGLVEAYLLPSPAAIWAEIIAFWPSLVSAGGITGLNSLVGLVAGSLLGVIAALIASTSKLLDGMLAPIVAALAVIPIVALAPVLNTMFGADSQTGRQLIASLAAFVPVFITTARGLRQTQPVHRELMTSFAATPLQVMRTITLPTAIPYTFTGIRLASSLAVISALVAEYFGGPRGGLGGLISTSAASSAYPRAWAYVAAAIVLGLAFYLVTLALERWASRRR